MTRRRVRAPSPRSTARATRAAMAVGDGLARWTRDWGRQASKAAWLARASRSEAAVLIAGLSNYLTESQKEELVCADAREGLRPVYRHYNGDHPSPVSSLEALSRQLTESQFALSLPSQMLRKVDMM